MIQSHGNSRRLLFIVIAVMVVVSFTLMVVPRFRPSPYSIEDINDPESDVPNNQPMPATQISTPSINQGTPPQSSSPYCKPDLRYKPKVTNPTKDQYMDLGDDGCHHSAIKSSEETLATEVGCDNYKMNFWLMWTTAREDWKLKHYRVIDSIYSLHPNATVHVFTKNMTADDFSFYTSRFKLIHHPLEFDKIFKHTPLERWHKTAMNNPAITNHKNFFSHLTDAMRLALLWKYGGVYMDTDAILLKKLDKVRNTIGYQGGNGNELNGAVLVFDRQHPFLYYVMHTLTRNHDVNVWGSAGPTLLTYTTMGWSQLDPMMVRWIPSPFIIGSNGTLPNEPLGTASISVFTDQYQFYPITWYNQGRVDIQPNHAGVPKFREDVEKRTYVYHYFNHMLEIWKKQIAPGTYLFELMQRGCLLACNNNDVETNIDDIKF